MIISKKPPYANTMVDPSKTQGQINKLLAGYGIDRYNWTNDLRNNQVALSFEVEAEIQGVHKLLTVVIKPPTFSSEHKTYDPISGKNHTVFAPNWAQSYRLLYYWLKAKLEAVAYGLTTVEKEFLSEVMVKLPTGEIKSFGEIAITPNFDKPQLTEQKEESHENVIDVEYKEVGQ